MFIEPLICEPVAVDADGLSSFETTTLPVSRLQRTSHQDGRSAKAGLQTPAMKPGLSKAGRARQLRERLLGSMRMIKCDRTHTFCKLSRFDKLV